MSVKRSFGHIREKSLKARRGGKPQRRYYAEFRGLAGERCSAPRSFTTKGAAEAWLQAEHELMERDPTSWLPPKVRLERERATRRTVPTLAEYGAAYVEARDLRPRTREDYLRALGRFLVPEFGHLRLDQITPALVKRWYAAWGSSTPATRANCYVLLHGILAEAVRDELIDRNPCHIYRGGAKPRVHQIKPATLAELETIANAMPERLRLLVQLAAWAALREGELLELRRGDVDTKAGAVQIRRAVSAHALRGEPGACQLCGRVVGPPKTAAGLRSVALPPFLLTLVREHLLAHAGPGDDGLLFPSIKGDHLPYGTLAGAYYKAREVAGRPDLRLHDLRHTGAVLAAQGGATLAELQARLGHSTVGAAMRYQHVGEDRDALLAQRLGDLHNAWSDAQ